MRYGSALDLDSLHRTNYCIGICIWLCVVGFKLYTYVKGFKVIVIMYVGQSCLIFTVLGLHLHQTTNICHIYRYNSSHDDWYISHLIGKVKLKFQQDFQSRNTTQTLVELCAIRDGLSTCNALSYLDACELMNLVNCVLQLDYIDVFIRYVRINKFIIILLYCNSTNIKSNPH